MMRASPRLTEPPPSGELNVNVLAPRTSFGMPPASGDFGELLHWCDSFSDTLHDVIDQLHTDMPMISSAGGQDNQEQPISDVVDQIYDIVLRLERIAKRAAG